MTPVACMISNNLNHWKRSVNVRNMNSKVKGNIRPGEEQLGDGIVRPSADLTARKFHSAAHTCDRNGPTLVIRTPDSSISIKSLSVPVLEPKWFPKRNLWLTSRRTFGTGLLCRRTAQEKVGKRAMLVQGDELLFSAQLVHLRDAWLAAR